MPRPEKIVDFESRRRVVGVGDDVVDESTTTTSTSQQQASLGERRLAGWLRRHLGVVGAQSFVKKWGARQIIAALHDDIVLWDERQERYYLNPKLHTPGAFLHYTLKARRDG